MSPPASNEMPETNPTEFEWAAAVTSLTERLGNHIVELAKLRNPAAHDHLDNVDAVSNGSGIRRLVHAAGINSSCERTRLRCSSTVVLMAFIPMFDRAVNVSAMRCMTEPLLSDRYLRDEMAPRETRVLYATRVECNSWRRRRNATNGGTTLIVHSFADTPRWGVSGRPPLDGSRCPTTRSRGSLWAQHPHPVPRRPDLISGTGAGWSRFEPLPGLARRRGNRTQRTKRVPAQREPGT